MTQVFLSYARQDIQRVRRLYDELRKRLPMHVWFDKVDLVSGLKWEPAIRKAIRESDYFVAVLSRDGVTSRGFRHSEVRDALRVADEFPDDWIYLVPARLDDCSMPIQELEQFTFADLFPEWGDGVDELCRALQSRAPGGGSHLSASSAEARPGRSVRRRATDATQDSQPMEGVAEPRAGYAPPFHYRIGLVDLGNLSSIDDMVAGLNGAQTAFHFSIEHLELPRQARTRNDGRPQLNVSRLPRSFYQRVAPLELDCVVCLTERFLAFEEGDDVLLNRLAGASPVNPRVLFISYADMDQHARESGVAVETGVAFLLTGELVDFFLERGYHDKTRNCPMDCTQDHDELPGGLRAGRFCQYCARALEKNRPFAAAFRAMLAWGR